MKFLALLLIALVAVSCDDRIRIEIYGESQCPDCTDFFTKSFKQAIETPDFLSICDYQVFEYGNASQKFEGGEWKFTCQHGSNECYGNIVETCAEKYIGENQIGDYLVCMNQQVVKAFWNPNFDNISQICADQLGVDNSVILKCASGDEGNQLEHEVADVTEALVPKHTYVPWVNVDGVHSTSDENAILSNMLKFVCQNYKGQNTIQGCQQYLNNDSTEGDFVVSSEKQCARRQIDILKSYLKK